MCLLNYLMSRCALRLILVTIKVALDFGIDVVETEYDFGEAPSFKNVKFCDNAWIDMYKCL
jgi:hypothetical protein